MSNQCLSWNAENVYYNSMCMFLLIPTFLFHILFWIQVCLYKTLRHCSLIWIYNYLTLDMISLTQILLEYITRRSDICGVNSNLYNLFCTLEAYTNNYITMVQSFSLILMNIYRYRLIVKSKTISMRSIVSLILLHLFIYLFPLSLFIIQYFTSSTKIISIPSSSCDVDISPLYNQVLSSLFLAVIPACINIPVLMMIIKHVRTSQTAVRSIRRIHRRLTIQFIILYSIWFAFFLPQIIFILSITSTPTQSLIAKALDIAATLSDVLVITLCDRRFIDAWKKSIHRFLRFIKRDDRRVNPIIPQNIELVRIR